ANEEEYSGAYYIKLLIPHINNETMSNSLFKHKILQIVESKVMEDAWKYIRYAKDISKKKVTTSVASECLSDLKEKISNILKDTEVLKIYEIVDNCFIKKYYEEEAAVLGN